MANKLLTQTGLQAAEAKSGAKDLVDGDLRQALRYLEYYVKDDMNARRDWLDDVIKAVPGAKKKAAADRALVKYLDDVLRAATTERKNIDTYLAKCGMRKVTLQVRMTNWDDDEMSDRIDVRLYFKGENGPEISISQTVKNGMVQFNGVELPPKGMVHVETVSRSGVGGRARGNNKYNLPNKSLVQLDVKQDSDDIPVKEKSGGKAVDKAGVKGKFGVDFKIWSGGKEITYEKELTEEHDKEIQYKIRVPKINLIVGKIE